MEFNNRMIKIPSMKTQASKFSTCNFQVSVWKTGTCGIKCPSRQLSGVQSIYCFDSASHFMRRTEMCLKSPSIIPTTRCINTKSKLGKRKTCKAVAKRFLRTGKGKLKRWRVGKNHKMMHKGPKRSRHLRKPTYVNKQQLKLLNKMLNGWWNMLRYLLNCVLCTLYVHVVDVWGITD